jgi:hypothetical protein
MAGSVARGVATVTGIVIVGAILHPSRSERRRVAWQLGVCLDVADHGTVCGLHHGPFSTEAACKAEGEALRGRIHVGRVRRTKVTVDDG